MRAVAFALVLPMAAAAQSASDAPITNGGSPLASPDGKWVAFYSNRDGHSELYVIASNGSEFRRVTFGPDRDAVAGWSADSREVLYSVVKAGSTPADPALLMAHNLSTGASRQIGQVPGRAAVVSPDGKRVLWSVGPMRTATTFVSALDGSSQQKLIDSTQGMAFNFAWSPDGSQIAFSWMTRDPRLMRVGVMNADGSALRTLAAVDTAAGGAQWPAWSPDGKRLAAQVYKWNRENPSQSTSHLIVADVATGQSRVIGAHTRPYLDETPSWIDNDTIAFQSDRSGRMEIWAIRADGSGERQITR